MQHGPELRQDLGALGKEQVVAAHMEFERQAVFDEGGGEEVKVSEEIFTVINGGPGADARTVIEQAQQRIMSLSLGNQQCGVALSCQSAPILRPCQRRSEAGGPVRGLVAARTARRQSIGCEWAAAPQRPRLPVTCGLRAVTQTKPAVPLPLTCPRNRDMLTLEPTPFKPSECSGRQVTLSQTR
jgi:hypothetical protein